MHPRVPTLWCHLPERLDSAAVSAVRGHTALHPSAGAIILEASRVSMMDPVGILRLWDFCQEQSGRGLRIELHHLHPALRHRLRAHPLVAYLGGGEELFDDPFQAAGVSDR